MGEQAPSSASDVPFPRQLLSDQSSPSKFDASDATDFFLARASAAPTNVMDQKSGFQYPAQRTISLRWLSASAARNGSGSSTPVRFPSLASATTAPSMLHRPEDTYFTRGGTESEYEAGLAPEATIPLRSHRHPMSHQQGPSRDAPQGSVLQFVARAFSSKKRTNAPSLSSASLPPSPITLEPPTPVFASNPSLPNFSSGSHCEQGATNPFQDIGLCSETPHGASHIIGFGRRHYGGMSESTPRRLRRKSSAHSETEQAALFDAMADLTLQELRHAKNLDVFDQDSKRVRFGDLWQGQRTCVIFIRHFWCPLCSDFMRSITEKVDPEMLAKAGVKLVVISNGSPAMIKSYRSRRGTDIFKFPFALYTDPSRAVYRALGMTLRTTDGGPESERGDYVKHGTASGIAMVVKNAVKARMPIHKKGGDIKQLGGEFVLGPGLCCSYVSRMHHTRSHAPIRDVLSAAGVDLDLDPVSGEAPPEGYSDEEQWMKNREVELRRIRAKRGMRRGFTSERRSSESSDFESRLPGTSEAGPLPLCNAFAYTPEPF